MDTQTENLSIENFSDSVTQEISVIIVNYNAGALLQKCIQSVLGMKEIIIVDNASTDNSLDICRTYYKAHSHIHYICNSKNRGFAAACNQGFLQASGSCLFFLNPDCHIEKDAIIQLYRALLSDSSVGMVGGALFNSDGSLQKGARRLIPTPWRAFVRAFGLYRLQRYVPALLTDFDLYTQPLPSSKTVIESISGACMLVKREAIVDVGLMDEKYFMHCEDLDWCMRFGQNGWKILFEPAAMIVHQKGACSKTRPFFVEWHKHKGMLVFYRKFFYRNAFFLSSALVVCGVVLHFFMTAISVVIKNRFFLEEPCDS